LPAFPTRRSSDLIPQSGWPAQPRTYPVARWTDGTCARNRHDPDGFCRADSRIPCGPESCTWIFLDIVIVALGGLRIYSVSAVHIPSFYYKWAQYDPALFGFDGVLLIDRPVVAYLSPPDSTQRAAQVVDQAGAAEEGRRKNGDVAAVFIRRLQGSGVAQLQIIGTEAGLLQLLTGLFKQCVEVPAPGQQLAGQLLQRL